MLSPATQQRLLALQRYFQAHGMSDPALARHEAVMLLGRTIQGQSYYLAYGDAFAMLGASMVVGLVATLFLRRVSGPAAPGAH